MEYNQNIENFYINWIEDLKNKIVEARHKTALSLNSALIELYWSIGQEIKVKESQTEWGSGFNERLLRDLTNAFPI